MQSATERASRASESCRPADRSLTTQAAEEEEETGHLTERASQRRTVEPAAAGEASKLFATLSVMKRVRQAKPAREGATAVAGGPRS